jgi:hypothetical protein
MNPVGKTTNDVERVEIAAVWFSGPSWGCTKRPREARWTSKEFARRAARD